LNGLSAHRTSSAAPGSHRRLIVNADDFGLSVGVNRGIARAHEEGILTSASLLVRAPHVQAAARYARAHNELGVGLHLDLEEWHYAGTPWIGAHETLDRADRDAVAAEIAAQLERFVALMEREPSHLDSHHDLHREDPACAIVLEHGARLDVPVRHFSPGIRYEGGFFAHDDGGGRAEERIGVRALCALLSALPPGTTELGCHPALDDASGSSYSGERTLETATLCSPAVRATVAEGSISLRSF
jgi:chitin disaccharide deacetylase